MHYLNLDELRWVVKISIIVTVILTIIFLLHEYTAYLKIRRGYPPKLNQKLIKIIDQRYRKSTHAWTHLFSKQTSISMSILKTLGLMLGSWMIILDTIILITVIAINIGKLHQINLLWQHWNITEPILIMILSNSFYWKTNHPQSLKLAMIILNLFSGITLLTAFS